MYSKQQCPVLTTQDNHNWADYGNHKLDQAYSIPLYHLHIHPAHHLANSHHPLLQWSDIHSTDTCGHKASTVLEFTNMSQKEKSMTWTVPNTL